MCQKKKNSSRKNIKMNTIKIQDKIYAVLDGSVVYVKRNSDEFFGSMIYSSGAFFNLSTGAYDTFQENDEIAAIFTKEFPSEFEVDYTEYLSEILDEQPSGTVICAFNKKTMKRDSDMSFFKTYGSEDNRWVDVFNANFSSETIAQTIIEETDLKFYFMALHGSTSSGDKEITF